MSAPWLMAGSALLFATMGVCVKLASLQYSAGELVFYRSLFGVLFIGALVAVRGDSLRTRVPALHFWRSLSGLISLFLWFYALGKLPLGTAMTLNYMSSVWIALFLVGGAVMLGADRVDGRLVAAVLVGFVGVALVLRPTLDPAQFWGSLAGLLSGVLAALAYLQLTALGRSGEPSYRIVFYFSLGGIVAGAGTMLWTGSGEHDLPGILLLVAVGLLATSAQMMMTQAFATGHTMSNAGLHYLGIVFAFVYGVLLFDEAITLAALAGVVLIVGAGLAATLLSTRAAIAAAASQAPPSQL